MEKITSSERKKILLSLLEYFDLICRENGLKYSLAGGTLLGAVRHHGFIPWDDDADVLMTRKEYEKLKQISNIENDVFGFMNENSSNYYYAFSKLYDKNTYLKKILPIDRKLDDLGIFLDIFPYDEVPDGATELLDYSKKINDLNDLMYLTIPGQYSLSKSKIKHFIKSIVFYPKYFMAKRNGLSTDELHDKLISSLQIYNNKNYKQVGFLLSEYHEKDKVPVEVTEDYQNVQFENLTLKAFKKYDVYLSNLYGDYMRLPAKQDRVSKHAYIGFWRV